MKLRLFQNTVRWRLTQSEVGRLGEGRTLEQATWFSETDRFVSRIVPIPGPSARATCTAGVIELLLPAERIAPWATDPSEVSIRIQQPIDAERCLEILVEKDFECLHPEPGAPGDTFPNPRRIRG
ncbi:MAG TPA: hypothetical protein PKB10_05630 [Tepidisphaeraceae bacterium]|nr:hypothetical protein [Tepidisphaeraceae bacterium]